MEAEKVVSVNGIGRGARRLARVGTAPLLPSQIVRDEGGLVEAEALVREGCGLIALMNHFSMRDSLEVLRLLYARPALRSRPTVAPVAAQHAGKAIYLLADLLAVQLCPINSPEALAELGPDAPPALSALEYTQQAVAVLGRAGIVPLSPQAGRRPALVRPAMRPLSMLMVQARRKRVQKIAILLLGLGIRNESDYSLAHAGGLNLGRVYEIQIGSTFTSEEALAAAGNWRALDDWALEQLRPLVPAAYRAEAVAPPSPHGMALAGGAE